jgi:hypothetical protein
MITAAMPAGQVDMSALILEALDEPATLNVSGAPLGEVFQILQGKTGVRITMSPKAVACLPHGANTAVDSESKGTLPLRELLTQVLRPFGLTFVVRDREIEVVARPAVLRIGRRASWNELETMEMLSARRDFGADLMSRIRLRSADPVMRSELEKAIRNIGAGSGEDQLTAAAESLGMTWYLDDQAIVVLSKEDQTRRVLDCLISPAYRNQELDYVIRDLGRMVGIRIEADGDALQSVAPGIRRDFTLMGSHIRLSEALDQIVGISGLRYLIDGDGILFEGTERISLKGAAAGRPAAAMDPIVAMINFTADNGRQVQLLIRESDLTPDTRALIEQARGEADDVIRDALLGHFDAPQTESPESPDAAQSADNEP